MEGRDYYKNVTLTAKGMTVSNLIEKRRKAKILGLAGGILDPYQTEKKRYWL